VVILGLSSQRCVWLLQETTVDEADVLEVVPEKNSRKYKEALVQSKCVPELYHHVLLLANLNP
jgi:hypothetical protein